MTDSQAMFHRASTGDSGYARSRAGRGSRQNTFTATQVSSRNDTIHEFPEYELSSSDLYAWLQGLFPEEKKEDFQIQVKATPCLPLIRF